MQQFDEYISEVIGKLSVSNKYRSELTEEFSDHLNMLKRDLVDSGLNEQAAAEEAIRLFGDSQILKHRLAASLPGYRTLPNVIFGVLLLFMIYLGGTRVPVGVTSWDDVNIRFFICIISFISTLILLVPFGYFLPIIIKWAGKALYVAIGALIAGLLMLLLMVGDFWVLPSEAVAMHFLGGLIGSLIGFCILKAVNHTFEKVRHLITIKTI